MNEIIGHIETNLRQPISYEALSRIAGCSVYEFFRIFSFMTGISAAEYIRRRRLSQAAFDIQNGSDKIIDVALRFCYESPTSFAKAFKDLHGTTPSNARKTGVSLKTYPPISFKLIIKGVDEMNFRIEKRDGFTIAGQTIYAAVGDMQDFTLPSIWSAKAEIPKGMAFANFEKPGKYEFESPGGKIFIDVENKGMATIRHTDGDGKVYEMTVDSREMKVAKVSQGTGGESADKRTGIYYAVAAFDFHAQDGKVKIVVGSEGDGVAVSSGNGEEIPAADWAVFSFTMELTPKNTSQAYARILTEWFPASGYKRDETKPHIEKFPMGEGSENHPWEIWVPVLKK
jgi:AraC family transcriptional regulator